MYKNIIIRFLLLVGIVIGVSFNACKKEPSFFYQTDTLPININDTNKVSIRFLIKSTYLTRAQLSDNFGKYYACIFDIKNSNGEEIINSKVSYFKPFNSDLATDTIRLIKGDYQLTRFWIIDDYGDIKYLVPLKGSIKANAVESSLPYTFLLHKTGTTNINPYVLSILGETPENFGYSSSFNPVKTFSVLIVLLKYDSSLSKFNFINGKLTVSSNNRTIQVMDIESKTNTVQIIDEYANYHFEIETNEFGTYKSDFSKEELLNYTSKPLIINF